MATAPVVLTVEEGIALVRLARPPANAIEISLVEALDATLARLSEDLPTAVVLTGAGSVFCAGIDVKVVPGYGREEQRRLIVSINRLIERVYGFPRPTIAAVNGHAIGGGLVLALACDVRLATTAACKLGLTEVTAGIPFPAGPITVVRAELAPQAPARSRSPATCSIPKRPARSASSTRSHHPRRFSGPRSRRRACSPLAAPTRP